MSDSTIISVTDTTPALCVGGVLRLSECDIALRIPDNLSEESFRYLLRWITTVVSHAESRRGLTTKIDE
jgi:hypothetical protein